MPVARGGAVKAAQKNAKGNNNSRPSPDSRGVPIGKGSHQRVLDDNDKRSRTVSQLHVAPLIDEEDDMQSPDSLQLTAQSICHNIWFKRCVNAAILMNVVQLGCSVEWTDEPYMTVWTIFDHIFVVVFLFEFMVKFLAMRVLYFRDYWNVLDFLLCWVGVADMWIVSFVVEGGADQMDAIKIFRLMRLVRMVKVIQTHRELQVLVTGMMNSLGGMFWTGLLLLLILYASAIFCVVMIGRADYDDSPKFNDQYFGTIVRSIVTLFGVCLLAEWSTVVRPVFENQPWVTPFFFIFVILTSCGVLNVIIGVIVERTNDAAQELREREAELARQARMELIKTIGQQMSRLDDEESISKQEMEKYSDEPEMQQMLLDIELPKGFSILDLYSILDEDADEALTYDEFVNGMYRLIYATDFQRICMMQLSMAKVRNQMRGLNSGMMDEVKRMFDRAHEEREALWNKAHEEREELWQKAQAGREDILGGLDGDVHFLVNDGAPVPARKKWGRSQQDGNVKLSQKASGVVDNPVRGAPGTTLPLSPVRSDASQRSPAVGVPRGIQPPQMSTYDNIEHDVEKLPQKKQWGSRRAESEDMQPRRSNPAQTKGKKFKKADNVDYSRANSTQTLPEARSGAGTDGTRF